MRGFWCGLMAVGVALWAAGCGSYSSTEAEMRARGAQRRSAPEVETPPQAAVAKAKPEATPAKSDDQPATTTAAPAATPTAAVATPTASTAAATSAKPAGAPPAPPPPPPLSLEAQFAAGKLPNPDSDAEVDAYAAYQKKLAQSKPAPIAPAPAPPGAVAATSAPPTVAAPAAQVAALPTTPVPPASTPNDASTGEADSTLATVAALFMRPVTDRSKLPVPDEEELAEARKLLKDLYGKQAEEARKPEERAKIAPQLLAEAPKVQANAVHYFELLRIVRDMAIAWGDAENAFKAVELLEAKYQVDGLTMRLETVEGLTKLTRTKEAASKLSQQAKDLMIQAIERDDFDAALRAQTQLVACARIGGDRIEMQRAGQTRAIIETARKAYAEVPGALQQLGANPDDGAAQETLGKYLCLVKGNWSAGLPLLARGDDLKLRILAAIDLNVARSSEQTLALADEYWALAEKARHPEARNLHLRAGHYYRAASHQLKGGLEKVRAEKRAVEVEEIYGAEEVKRALVQMAGGRIATTQN